jgi:hypothetical protein
MFVVNDILVSDALMDAPFACDLGACLGGCCVQGDSGAPLEPDELAESTWLFRSFATGYVQRPSMSSTREVHGKNGAGHFATTCVDDAECVFVTYDRGIAKCSLQQAHASGEIVSKSRFPVTCILLGSRKSGNTLRSTTSGLDLCQPGVINGERLGIQLSDVLRRPSSGDSAGVV